MGRLIQLVLSNFTLTFLIVGLIASAIVLARAPKPLTTPVVVEALFAYFILFSIGFSFFYNFVMHTFFGGMAARFIGWADSPFQAEVGFASLGFAVIGFLAFRGSFVVPKKYMEGVGVEGHAGDLGPQGLKDGDRATPSADAGQADR